MKLIIAFFLLVASGKAIAQQCCITAYDKVNYEGDSRRYCGDANWAQFFSKDFNDRITSVRVPACCSVTLYDADFKKFAVDPITLTADTPDLSPFKMDNVTSSLSTKRICTCPMTTTLVPLYRAANNIKYPGSQIYTASFESFKALIITYQYLDQLAVSGQVATSNEGCNGQLKPVYRLAQPWNLDRVMTSDKAAVEAIKAGGYNDEGLAFYCSATKQDDCGATVPLHCYTYTGNSDGKPRHTCHTDQGEAAAAIAPIGTGATYDGVLCYIWPPPAEGMKAM